jgi:cytochrome c biogenesis protein CcmG, thiol:disulfide interchange protein DsbE
MHRRCFVRQSFTAALLALAGVPSARAQAVGAPAPAFDLPGVSAPVRLAQLRGRVVLLDFWASWCAPCKLSFPWLDQMQAKYARQGLKVVAINVDARRADADRFLASTPVQLTVAFDPEGQTPRAYAIRAMPSSFLIAPDGRVLYTHAGFRESDKAALEDRIRAALAQA